MAGLSLEVVHLPKVTGDEGPSEVVLTGRQGRLAGANSDSMPDHPVC